MLTPFTGQQMWSLCHPGCVWSVPPELLFTDIMSSQTQTHPLRFGQVVIGPPGSGKTTYCQGMQEFLTRLGRKLIVVNMDPANEGLPYSCAVDISELVTLDDVMEGLKLGPNGGLLYCMEYVEANLDWLENKLKEHGDCYFLFDCPGQVELYTHQRSVKNIFSQLGQWNFRVRLWKTKCFIVSWGTPPVLFMCVQQHIYDCCSFMLVLADSSTSCGLALLRRPSQVHLCAVHLPVHHAARGAPPCQHPLQDGPDWAVWKIGCVWRDVTHD